MLTKIGLWRHWGAGVRWGSGRRELAVRAGKTAATAAAPRAGATAEATTTGATATHRTLDSRATRTSAGADSAAGTTATTGAATDSLTLSTATRARSALRASLRSNGRTGRTGVRRETGTTRAATRTGAARANMIDRATVRGLHDGGRIVRLRGGDVEAAESHGEENTDEFGLIFHGGFSVFGFAQVNPRRQKQLSKSDVKVFAQKSFLQLCGKEGRHSRTTPAKKCT